MQARFIRQYPVVAARSLDALRNHRPFARPLFTLMSPVWFEVDERLMRIPEGVQTNFASVPRLLLAVLPPHGCWREPAAVHDGLYGQQAQRFDARTSTWVPLRVGRAWADEVFLALMESVNVRPYGRFPMYWAVRCFGGRCFTGQFQGRTVIDASPAPTAPGPSSGASAASRPSGSSIRGSRS